MCKVTNPAVAAILVMLATTWAQASPAAAERPIILAQGAFTFGSRDDLGPRYDPYSERWGRHAPTEATVCRWVTVRTPQFDGKVVLRRQRVCGFKVPARE
jgi:hypothetical protein